MRISPGSSAGGATVAGPRASSASRCSAKRCFPKSRTTPATLWGVRYPYVNKGQLSVNAKWRATWCQ